MERFGLALFLFITVLHQVHGEYHTVHLEDFCQPNVESTWTYRLLPSGYNSTVIIRPSHNNTYSSGMDCTVNLYPPVGYGVIAAIRKISFQQGFKCENYIQIEGSRSTTHCLNKDDPSESETSYSEETMQLYYRTGASATGRIRGYSGFEVIFTTYAKGAHCSDPGAFKCKNDKCIWAFLTCDGHNNCEDRSDEDCELCGGCNYTETYLEDLCKNSEEEWTSIEVQADGINSVGILKPTNQSGYTYPWDCLVNFKPHDGFGMSVLINTIDFVSSNCTDYLKVFPDTKEIKLCSSSQVSNSTITSNFSMQLEYKTRLKSGAGLYHEGFILTYAANSIGDNCDIPGRFMCRNKRCISSQLLCDSHNNCGDDSDESCEICGGCGPRQIFLETRCKQSSEPSQSNQWNNYAVKQPVSPDQIRIPVQGNSSGIIQPRNSSSYSDNMNCITTLVPPSSHGIVVSIQEVDFKFDNCSDFLTIYNGTQTTTVCSQKDLSDSSGDFVSSGPIQIDYRTKNSSLDNIGFRLIYTVYIETNNCTSEDQFLCKNNICISSDLKCNGRNNCGDNSDEDCELCGNCKKSHVTEIIIGVIVAAIFIIALIALLFWMLQRKKSKDESSERIIDSSSNETHGYGSVDHTSETTRPSESTNGHYENA